MAQGEDGQEDPFPQRWDEAGCWRDSCGVHAGAGPGAIR